MCHLVEISLDYLSFLLKPVKSKVKKCFFETFQRFFSFTGIYENIFQFLLLNYRKQGEAHRVLVPAVRLGGRRRRESSDIQGFCPSLVFLTSSVTTSLCSGVTVSGALWWVEKKMLPSTDGGHEHQHRASGQLMAPLCHEQPQGL